MKSPFDERYENDPTPSREVARRYRAAFHDDDASVSLALLSYRGGEEEFRLGQEYCASTDPTDRATGAHILSQLGWGDQNFQEESVRILISLLDDPRPLVISSAAFSLGHRHAPSAIPALLRHVAHPDPKVRRGVSSGLSTLEDPRAVAALITLAADRDHDTRNWSVFHLGTLIDFDSPALRDALRHALSDKDDEIRGEALVGLARRKDPDIVRELIHEWDNDDISILSIEAAGITRDPRLQWHLQELTEMLSLSDDSFFARVLTAAIALCEPDSTPLDQDHPLFELF